ncbi:MAG TPA: class I SAM-dependent RNA methyltransferase [Deltaproteobacteria bacterium]|mgnify:CR=1 FL=1|nr:class I SAM-dependent RNA methyltransferase [Deltaproteobacteria bacterium]
MNVGDVIELAIDSVAFGGEGVGRIDDRVVFVPFTVDGDVVKVKISEVRKRYARGDVAAVTVTSPKRTEPRCRHYYRCGGCQYQHIAYEHQAAMKKQQVIDAFMRIGKIPLPPVADTVPSPMIYNYRGKAEYHLEWTSPEKPVMGFKDTTGATVVDIDRCEIVHESINGAVDRFRNDISAGGRHIRRTRTTFWSASHRTAESADIRRSLTFAVVERPVKGKVLYVPAGAFFQANLSLIDTLVDMVIGRSAGSSSDALIDCYCGSGLFALFLSSHLERIYGIEMDKRAVRCARVNMKRHNMSNVIIVQGRVEEVLQSHVFDNEKIGVILLDPPRTGCAGETLSQIVSLNPRRIVYVSCNPATQARDVRTIIDAGFRLVELQPIDMFPQTKHIEVIALLDRLT